MNRSVRGHAALGLALLLLVAAISFAILSAFTGHFSTYDVVYADVPASGTGISPGSVVIFRDITVGSVGSLGRELPNGLLHVQLHLTPGDLDSIPADVKADVEIATIFGTQGINLVPSPHGAAGHLRVGATVGSVPVSNTTTLQGDATDLDNLLNALHPAALDETLTAIATALNDQGPQLGATIAHAATYLDEMLPQLPTIVSDLARLGPVANELGQATPSLIATLSNASVFATTLTDDAAQFHQLLAGGTPTVQALTGLLQGAAAPFDDLVANSAALLGDVNANPDFVAQTLAGFDAWSKAFATAEEQGPYLSFAGDITVSGGVQAVAAALGVPGSNMLVEQGLGPQYFNPPTYSSADCPTYQGEAGPNCAQATASSGSASSSHTVVTTAAEEQAAATIAAGLDGGTRPPSPAVTALLLQPLLSHLAGSP